MPLDDFNVPRKPSDLEAAASGSWRVRKMVRFMFTPWSMTLLSLLQCIFTRPSSALMLCADL
jgi:hypothetical protein